MKSLLQCDYKEMGKNNQLLTFMKIEIRIFSHTFAIVISEEYLEFQSVRDWHDKNELLQPIYRLQS